MWDLQPLLPHQQRELHARRYSHTAIRLFRSSCSSCGWIISKCFIRQLAAICRALKLGLVCIRWSCAWGAWKSSEGGFRPYGLRVGFVARCRISSFEVREEVIGYKHLFTAKYSRWYFLYRRIPKQFHTRFLISALILNIAAFLHPNEWSKEIFCIIDLKHEISISFIFLLILD